MEWLELHEPMTRRRALLFSHTFDVAGEYRYSCMLHRPMVGHLSVSA